MRTATIEWFRLNRIAHHYKMQEIYAEFGISKQGHAAAVKRLKQRIDNELLYVGFIVSIRRIHPGMGLRLMYEQFSPEGIGRDAFISLGLYNGFRLKAAVNPVITTRKAKYCPYSNLIVDKRLTNVNQLWASDLFYFHLNGKHYYIVLILDVYSRRIIGYSAADNMRAEQNIKALNMALQLRGIKKYNNQLIHHSDRGGQYVSEAYTSLLSDYEIKISMCTNVLDNSYMERANGTIKNNYLKLWPIKNELQLKSQFIHKAIDAYNNRQHRSLGKKTPIEFETYVKELSQKQRPVMKVFTVSNQNSDNINQLSLFEGL